MLILNESNFDESIAKGVSLVDFYADWCMPCRSLAPILEDLKLKMPSVNFFKLNIEDSQDLAGKYDVSSIPLMVIMRDGKEVNRIVGLMKSEDIEKKINEVLKVE